jgi:DHA1 family bicyclomycin/chloramphenicol resistance-like MFS transporter
MGHIAGLAASLMGSLATIGGAALGAVVGQLYNGTALPLVIAVGSLSALAALIMRKMPREAA